MSEKYLLVDATDDIDADDAMTKGELLAMLLATDTERSSLTKLLAIATTAHEDFDMDYQNVIVTIGKGMFWSKEFDMAARELAARIDARFEMVASASGDGIP